VGGEQERIAIELLNPVTDKLKGFVEANRQDAEMVQPGTCAEQTLALCGAGPSLRTLTFDRTDHLWACNSALPWLVKEGIDVSVGIGIDQTPGLLREWETPPDVMYYVASSCDPELVAHLRAHGRQVRLFHNFVGFEGEWEMYCEDYPPGYMVGEGMTVVSRSIGLAKWVGFERVDIYGADCAFDDDVVHANGDDAQAAYGNPMLMQSDSEIGGKKWVTRPDMLMDAVDLARRTKQGGIRLMGDTLPVALMGKSDEYLDAVIRRLKPGETPNGDDNG